MAKRKSDKSKPQVFKFADSSPFNVYGSGIRIKDPALCWKIMQRAANQRAEQLDEAPPASYSRVEFNCKQSGLHPAIIKNGRNYVLETGYKASLKQSKAGSKRRKEAGKEINAEAIDTFKEMRPKYKSDKTCAIAVCKILDLDLSPNTLIDRVKQAKS